VTFLIAARILPVCLDRLPEVVVQSLVVSVAVLHHDGGDPKRERGRSSLAMSCVPLFASLRYFFSATVISTGWAVARLAGV